MSTKLLTSMVQKDGSFSMLRRIKEKGALVAPKLFISEKRDRLLTQNPFKPNWKKHGKILSLCSRVVVSFSLSLGVVAPANAQQNELVIGEEAQEMPGGSQLSQQALSQISALMSEKANRTPAQQKISSRLLHAKKLREGVPLANGLSQIPPRVNVEESGMTLVDIEAEVSVSLLSQIEGLGGEIVNSFPEYHAVRARIPLERIEEIASIPQVRSIAPASKPMTNALNPNANTVTQGDIAHRANQARSQFKVEGKGVSVGVISDSVDTLSARQASGDLPSNVSVLSSAPGSAGNPRDEGTAMLEIVHDVAPQANLLFATGWQGKAAFASNIRALAKAGAKVIVDDITYFDEPVFEDGVIAEAVNEVVKSGVTYFSSAGNSGNLNDGQSGVWEGNFVPIAAPSVLGAGVVVHDFGEGRNSNLITQDDRFVITLQWSDPWGGSTNDYDLYILDQNLIRVVDFSNNTQNGTQNPYEAIDSSTDAMGNAINHRNNRIVIVRNSGQNRYIHVNTNRGRLAIGTDGSTFGHNAAESAITVAAVNVDTANGGAFRGGTTNPVETYSSDGPRRLFFDATGTPITPGNFLATGGRVVQKPDIAAGDCVATDAIGFNPFCGTSAAAPHAAAIAALMKAENSSLTPAHIRHLLGFTALDIETKGVDRDSGYGIIDANGALKAVSVKYPTRLSPNGDVYLNGEGAQKGKLSFSWLAAPGARWYRVTVMTSSNDTIVWKQDFAAWRLGCETEGICKVSSPIDHKPGDRYKWWVTASSPASTEGNVKWEEHPAGTVWYSVFAPPSVTSPSPNSYVHDGTRFEASSPSHATGHAIWFGVKDGNGWKSLGSGYYSVAKKFTLPTDHKLEEGQAFELWYYTTFQGQPQVASQQRYTYTKKKLLEPHPGKSVDDKTLFKGAHPKDTVRHTVWIGRQEGGRWVNWGNKNQPYMPVDPQFRLPSGHKLTEGQSFELWYYTEFTDGHKEVDHQTYYYKKKGGIQ